jgi:hypothetical protein
VTDSSSAHRPSCSTHRRALEPVIRGARCQHAGLWLDRFVGGYGWRDGEAHEGRAVEEVTTSIPAAYHRAFEKWRRTLAALGAESEEVEVNRPIPVGGALDSVLNAPARLHQIYGTPFIPGAILMRIAAHALCDHVKESRLTAVFADREGAGEVTFFDALYVPGSASHDCPIVPFTLADRGQGEGWLADPAWRTRGAAENTFFSPFVAARGRYLIAAAGSQELVGPARIIVARALTGEERGSDTVRTDRPGTGEVGTERSPRLGMASEPEPPAEVEVSAEQTPLLQPEELQGPREWGVRTVLFSPHDGSLHVTGPASEKGVAGRREVEQLVAGKRKAKLLVTVEPMGNAWKIVKLEPPHA